MSNATTKVKSDAIPLLTRLRLKYISFHFLGHILWVIMRYVLLVGLCFIILFPFFSKISASVMGEDDFRDKTVSMIPKHPTLQRYRDVMAEVNYWDIFRRTVGLSLAVGVIEMFACTLVGYGFAKFRFKGNRLLFMLVVFTMIVPPQTYITSLFMRFRYFDIFGVIEAVTGAPISFIDSFWPVVIMAATCVYFKNGLYIFIMRQYFMGVPDELEEAAYVDGAGVFSTFLRVIIPMSFPMMITIFMFSFAWQWTDIIYSGVFFSTTFKVMSDIPFMPKAIYGDGGALRTAVNASSIINTGALLAIIPLIIFYAFGQRFLIGGIERSGIVG